MTTTSKEHRQRRYRMALAYLNRRAFPGWRDGAAPVFAKAYNEWVDAFPKFMVIAYPGKRLRRDARTARQGDNTNAPKAGRSIPAKASRDLPHA